MPRLARLVVPGYPHHITQRGSRRQQTFFDSADYRAYRDLMIRFKEEAGVEIWAYCLMPNHVHLVAVPQQAQSLARLLRIAHHRYARRVNAARGWSGHLWQERFHSFVMDEPHLLAAVRYVELNPVRAGLCAGPGDWPWSSAPARLYGKPDRLLTPAPMRQRISDWNQYLAEATPEDMPRTITKNTRTGRPAGRPQFVEKLEQLTGRR
jgi:putative transposase